MPLKFDEWPPITIRHLFYTSSSFLHHFKSIGEFKLELQSGNAQFGSKLAIFCPACVILKFDGWPWKTIGHLFYTTSSFVHHFKSIGEVKLELQSGNAQLGSQLVIFCPCDLEIWQMTLKNNRAPLYTTLSFAHHFKAIGEFKLELQSGNAQFGSKSMIFLAVWPWNLTDDLEQQ